MIRLKKETAKTAKPVNRQKCGLVKLIAGTGRFNLMSAFPETGGPASAAVTTTNARQIVQLQLPAILETAESSVTPSSATATPETVTEANETTPTPGITAASATAADTKDPEATATKKETVDFRHK